MSLADPFEAASAKSAYAQTDAKPKKKRLPPFSIRLSEEERAHLLKEAAGVPLGAYIKTKALGPLPIAPRHSSVFIGDKSAIAKVLALLGRSRLAGNLNQIAHAVNIGSLPMTPETEAELFAAIRDVRDIRRLLIAALGLKPEASP